jgi:hypothetical protein
MQAKYKLFQQVYCWLDKGLARGTISQVEATYRCSLGWPMGQPLVYVRYQVMVENVPFWLNEVDVDLSKLRLEKRNK